MPSLVIQESAPIEYTFKLSDEHVRKLPDGSLVVSGYASTYDVDRVGDTVMRKALEDAVADYMKNPQLLYMHRRALPAGAVTRARVDDKGLWIEATVRKPAPDAAPEVRHWFGLVRDGLARSFSIGGRWIRDAQRRLQKIDMTEISIATLPVNASTLMGSYAKAFDDAPSAVETINRADVALLAIDTRLALLDAKLSRLERAAA